MARDVELRQIHLQAKHTERSAAGLRRTFAYWFYIEDMIHLFIYLFVYSLYIIYLFTFLFIYLFTYLFIYLFISVEPHVSGHPRDQKRGPGDVPLWEVKNAVFVSGLDHYSLSAFTYIITFSFLTDLLFTTYITN